MVQNSSSARLFIEHAGRRFYADKFWRFSTKKRLMQNHFNL
jgi:hypothetical protein